MTPQERQLVTELFDRLARLETTPRDADAERAMAEGLRRAPHAIYPLVQTVLLQDEALKRADARIRELGGEAEPASGGGFLDTMRNAFSGRGSVPSVPGARAYAPDPRWNSGAALAGGAGAAPAAQQSAAPSQGGSFLGTAAATAAGVIGGAMLYSTIGSLFGGQHSGSAFGNVPPANAHQGGESPWGNDASGGDLSREAGLNDIGRGGDNRAGLFDDNTDVASLDDSDFGGGDFGGGGDA